MDEVQNAEVSQSQEVEVAEVDKSTAKISETTQIASNSQCSDKYNADGSGEYISKSEYTQTTERVTKLENDVVALTKANEELRFLLSNNQNGTLPKPVLPIQEKSSVSVFELVKELKLV